MLALGAAGVAVAGGALYGWGRLVRSLAGLPNGTWPLSIVLGLAFILFLGGILNLGRVGYPPSLAVLFLGGLALTGWAVRRDGWPRRRPGLGALPWGLVVMALTGLMIVTQLAPTLYNSYDDFQYYFAHAVRMVQTGSLYGSPLNASGGESLGGQAFLQAFVVGGASAGGPPPAAALPGGMLQSTRLRAARSSAAKNRAFFTCARNAIGSGVLVGAAPCAPG